MTEFIQHLRWRPTIGDPSLMGWLTVAAYGLAAIIAFFAARRAGRAPGLATGSRATWLMVSALMTFLCLNKQLDLQSLFTDIGRVVAYQQGWYEDRREFQKWFVMGALGASCLTALVTIIVFHRFWRNHFLLAFGLAFMITFIGVRAISFHHVDAFLGSRVAGAKMNWVLELGGIALVMIAAIRDWRYPRRPPPPPWKPAQE
ncbi:MAG: hypothetical protein MUF86_05540 [Akkermansiaceae bacterium]|nr:hypothetical protein [Akkermansiaceae bacterium]